MQPTQPAFFKQGPRPLTQLLLYASLSAILMVGDHHFKLLNSAREYGSVLLYPLQWLATAPVSAMRETGKFLTAQTELQKENRELRNQQLLANAELLRMDALKHENEQLRALTATNATRQGKGILTEVLYNGRDPFSAQLIVDRGETSGVKTGLVVIDPNGVVGQITRVNPLVSQVTLLSEKNHAVPVEVKRNGLRAVVFGMGKENPLEVRYMPAASDIRKDDILITSGLDGTYPAGLPVARVMQVDQNSGMAFVRIQCQPIANIDKNRFFLILDESRTLPPAPEPPKQPETKRKKRRGEE
ncbi:rod shape-determining protein MreC [Parachitinimonas caeni]|uniref:Cell shape-determining protein MreC n=1 Tax=Parachitinimonas caeni TaxID=3031301 RepID=A0ABT7E0K5_9NEIS|nr:rod shape-determining protein MreC [Parachitinimonas caeni]MDK2124960.1 rod shape-determining protein MreC [Parachitinimonas caeni]